MAKNFRSNRYAQQQQLDLAEQRRQSPQEQLKQALKRFNETDKNSPNRGKLRDVLTAAVKAGHQTLLRQQGVRHEHLTRAQQDNSPMLPPQIRQKVLAALDHQT